VDANTWGNSPSVGRALDKVAKAVGRDRKSIAKAVAIGEVVKANPDDKRIIKTSGRHGPTGRVDGPFKRLKVIKQAGPQHPQGADAVAARCGIIGADARPD
jgi:hypothetical protein